MRRLSQKLGSIFTLNKKPQGNLAKILYFSIENWPFDLTIVITCNTMSKIIRFHLLTVNDLYNRRVHVTKATLLQLGDRFEVETGNGGSRESYLAKHKIETFFIIPPEVSRYE